MLRPGPTADKIPAGLDLRRYAQERGDPRELQHPTGSRGIIGSRVRLGIRRGLRIDRLGSLAPWRRRPDRRAGDCRGFLDPGADGAAGLVALEPALAALRVAAP